MVYFDTSALVPMFIRESKSDAILEWLETSGERLAISEWTMVEFASAASLKSRTGATTTELAIEATARMRDFAQKRFTIAVPGQEEFRRAASLAGDPTLKLRAGDALHIAMAQSLSAHGLFCLDDAMIGSAELLGIRVITV